MCRKNIVLLLGTLIGYRRQRGIFPSEWPQNTNCGFVISSLSCDRKKIGRGWLDSMQRVNFSIIFLADFWFQFHIFDRNASRMSNKFDSYDGFFITNS